MGTVISLDVGGLAIDWGKNEYFNCHSSLFQEGDVFLDVSEIGAEEGSTNEALKRPLLKIVRRIELMGYTLSTCEQRFGQEVPQDDSGIDLFEFSEFVKVLLSLDIVDGTIVLTHDSDSSEIYDLQDLVLHLLNRRVEGREPFTEFDVGEFLERIHPYVFLRILADHERASELIVVWDFGPLVEAGWADKGSLVRPVAQESKFLIITEGSSDSNILRKAFNIIYPEISDFFYYIDMEKNYPFGGASGLVQFAKGLVSMAVRNDVLLLFDNDAEGLFQFNFCRTLPLPSNVRAAKLPDIEELAQIPTIGPAGEHIADLNGCGAAIECYLDLSANPKARWKNYLPSMDKYQAEIFDKTGIQKMFFAQKELSNEYDFSKITKVLDLIYAECTLLRESEFSSSQA